MKTLKCLIADDEPLAIDLVANFLTRLDITDITRCGNGVEAFQQLQQSTFDLLFLDIDMPVLSGIELLKSLSHRPAVVITTAYRDYAVEGFELEVLDYLVKPFSFARFMQTMEKVNRCLEPATAAKKPEDPEKDFLFLKVGKELIKVLVADIRYIESKKDYIRVFTTKGQWLCHQSLTDITAKLSPEKFFRVHRSYTVALDKIDKAFHHSVHIQENIIPVSRENRHALRQRLSSGEGAVRRMQGSSGE